MAQGIKAGQANPEYQRLQSELAGLQAGQKAGKQTRTAKQIKAEAEKRFPVLRKGGRMSNAQKRQKREALENQKIYIADQKGRIGQDYSQQIASLKSQLKSTPKPLEGTAG